MGGEEYQRVENSCFLYQKDHWNRKNVEVLEEVDDASSSISSINSTISNGSLSSELGDDASSSSNSCSPSLNDLSELMSQLPIKRGLSNFYNGKSESFTSLSRVTSIEDLAKKQIPYCRKSKIKSSKSYGGGLDNYKLYTLPKSCISKKNKSRGSVISFSCNNSSRRGSFVSSGRPPLMPSEKSFGC